MTVASELTHIIPNLVEFTPQSQRLHNDMDEVILCEELASIKSISGIGREYLNQNDIRHSLNISPGARTPTNDRELIYESF